MTDTTDTTGALPERPAHCRSPLWDHIERISTMLESRYSYEQIARAMKKAGVTLTASEVGKWCRRQGLRSAAPSRHRPRADKTSAPSTAPAAPEAPAHTDQAPPAKTSASPLADALGPEPADEWASFRKPSEDRS